MATVAEQLTSLANTKTAIKDAIVAKGVPVADTDTFASYATKIGEIQAGGGGEVVNKTKYGMTVDTFLGDVDAEGTLGWSSESAVVLDFSGVKKIGSNALGYRFYRTLAITGIQAPSLTTVDTYGMRNAFNNCTNLRTVDFGSLQTVENSGLESAFDSCYGLVSIALGSLKTVGVNGMRDFCSSCSGLTSVSMESLQTIDDYGLQDAFSMCSKLKNVNLDSLQTVGPRGLRGAFYGCTALTSMSFPSLTSVVTDSFGTTSVSTQMFYNCTAMTEIHFRADMQTAIEAMDGYANKWGATNATIYFDL